MMFFGGAFHAGYYFISKPGLSPESANLIPQVVLNDFTNHLEMLSYLGCGGFLSEVFCFLSLHSMKGFRNGFAMATRWR